MVPHCKLNPLGSLRDGLNAHYFPLQPPSSQTPPPTFTAFFRVTFYVENISTLKYSQTRHQYYLQLRRDILGLYTTCSLCYKLVSTQPISTSEGKTYCHEEVALKLAAYALQAEKGDYDHQHSRYGYFRLEDYLPKTVMEKVNRQYIHDILPDMHEEKYGLSREKAELEFLKV